MGLFCLCSHSLNIGILDPLILNCWRCVSSDHQRPVAGASGINSSIPCAPEEEHASFFFFSSVTSASHLNSMSPTFIAIWQDTCFYLKPCGLMYKCWTYYVDFHIMLILIFYFTQQSVHKYPPLFHEALGDRRYDLVMKHWRVRDNGLVCV